MARIKYYYDTETCKYERIKTSPGDVFLNFLGFIAVAFFMAIGIVFFYIRYFESPEEALLRKDNQELQFHYELLGKKIDNIDEMLKVLQERDDNIYRVIYEAEPIPSTIREAGIGGSDRYKNISEKGLERGKLILDAFKGLDKLKKKMYIQTKSYDEILELANNKTELLASIPAIQPISNKELTRLASGFGLRIHPIYKVRKMHWGIDFSAPRGTPIHATGDGKITKLRKSITGYGKEIEIDHGFGYKTKYAHLQSFNVKKGQKIKRGETIGYVGSTGTSTAPHLHYEVIKNNKKVNPIHYFFQDITEKEYEKLVELASIENQHL